MTAAVLSGLAGLAAGFVFGVVGVGVAVGLTYFLVGLASIR